MTTMVTSSGASSSLDQPGVHRSPRNAQQSQHDRSSRISVTVQPTSQSPHRSPSSGPAVVSRYMLPTYRQASSSNVSSSLSQLNTSSNPAIHPLNASLPDILHSHLAPQIPRLRQNQRRQHGDQRHTRERHRSETDVTRHGHSHHNRHERRRTRSSSSQSRNSCACKEPCVKCVVTFTSFRWVLVVLSILGVCCVVSGVVLAALHAAGSSFLFLAVMFIGLGVLLVIVVSVGWKCTPRGHEPLHALFHIGQFGRGGSRDRHRRRRHRHRDGNWFGGVMYPELQYRRPPPSYAASMQDYQNQSLQELSSAATSHLPPSTREGHESVPGSPPPSYHSRTSTMHSGMNIGADGGSQPNSRPPTYRSRAPSRRPSLPRQNSLGDGETINNSLPSGEFSNIDLTSNDDNTISATARAIAGLNAAPTATLTHTIEISQPDGDPVSNVQSHVVPSTSETTTTDLHSTPQGADIINHPNRQFVDADIIVTNQPVSFIASLPTSDGNFEPDVQQLEQALQPLESMDDDGIDNPAANISSDYDHYDTHL